MDETATQILNLMNNTGKSAPDMTHALKIIGDGNMQKGIIRFGDYFGEEFKIVASQNLRKGRIQGVVVGGMIGGTIAAVVHFVKERKNQKEHDQNGQKIKEAIEKSIESKDQKDENDSEVFVASNE